MSKDSASADNNSNFLDFFAASLWKIFVQKLGLKPDDWDEKIEIKRKVINSPIFDYNRLNVRHIRKRIDCTALEIPDIRIPQDKEKSTCITKLDRKNKDKQQFLDANIPNF